MNCPGADDNGSGVMVLLKLAEWLKSMRLNKTVQLVLSSNEEYGRHGSTAYVADLKRRGNFILSAINIDIIGYNRPFAIFSGDVIDAMKENFTIERKIKILLKESYNAAMFFFHRNRTLKLICRNDDRKLMPDSDYIEKNSVFKKVKFIIDDDCG